MQLATAFFSTIRLAVGSVAALLILFQHRGEPVNLLGR